MTVLNRILSLPSQLFVGLFRLLVPSASTVLLGFHYITSRGIVWFSVIGFAVGILVLIVVTSVMNGFVSELRASIRGSLSDLIIRPVPRHPGLPPPDLSTLRKVLGGVPGVIAESVSPRITWLAMIAKVQIYDRYPADDGSYEWVPRSTVDSSSFTTRDDALACQIIGIDIETDRLATNFAESLVGFEKRPTRHVQDIPVPRPEDPFHRRTRPDPALLPADVIESVVQGEHLTPLGVFGAFLARKLDQIAGYAPNDFFRGSSVYLLTFPPEALAAGERGEAIEPGYREVIMSGTFRTGTYDVDVDKIFMDRKELARHILGMREGWEDYYTEIVLRASVPEEELYDTELLVRRAFLASDELRNWDFRVSTWMAEKRNQVAAIDYEKKMMAFILGFIILVAGINMFTTLWMMVTEKTRDVGIISALGVSRLGILQLFLTMGVFIALIGEVIGVILGLLIVKYIGPIEQWLFDWFGFKMFDPTIYVFDHLPAKTDPLTVAIILVATFIGAVIFSIAPAIRAAIKHPVQALRYE